MSVPFGHTVQVDGEGFFSSATCTGCAWASRGHADDLVREWTRYHENEDVETVEPDVTVPAPTGDEFLCELERQIIFRICHHVRYGDKASVATLYVALGLAHARWTYIRRGRDAGGWTPEEANALQDGPTYVSTLTARISHIHRRQQDKLSRSTRTRAEQQILLERGNL